MSTLWKTLVTKRNFVTLEVEALQATLVKPSHT
jgi:hypothetical protein